jgi:protein-S-isoprenylcysteine O-methyltransferase Ste14
MMNRFLTLAYGAVAYLVFLVSFLYAIAFIGNIAVPRSIDNGISASLGEAIVVNLALLGAFGVQHSVMARPAFKRWWTRLVPNTIERSTYVLLSSLLLILLFWQWRTMPEIIWDVTWPAGRIGVWVLFWTGWVMALTATVLINHFDLFGLRQVYLAWREKPYTEIGFRTPLLYRVVRHPLQLGFLFAFWATPTMTAGHLLFAAATTAYILVALKFEEHDLIAALGEQYREYRRRVPMLIPGLPRRGRDTAPDRTPRAA